MSQIDKESISALLDNEADDLELRRFLKACEQDPSLLETWERFSLAQSALHESAVPVNPSLAQRIAAQIEQEAPLAAVPVANPHSSWKDSLSKMAIAASVAAVFLVTVQVNLDNGAGSPAVSTLAEQSSRPVEVPVVETLAASTLLAESTNTVPLVVDDRYVTKFIESLTLDEKEPVVNEQIQDSPLYRLVNEYRVKP